ncbi:MAG: hypothetical protein AAGC53_02795 [Actinomycetota bacterium]
MRTFSTHTDHLRGHRPRAVVLAVTDPGGLDDAAHFLHQLPALSCPVVVSPAHAVRAELARRLADTLPPVCVDGAWLTDAPTWLLPASAIVTVAHDRWVIDPCQADDDAQIGRLLSSLKASYRSRVFMVDTAGTLETNPFAQLLAQRGAPLAETCDRSTRGVGAYAPVAEILAHLAANVGIIEKASA